MRLLFVGDIVGNPGRSALKALLPELSQRHSPDMVVVNGENAAGGFGITEETARDIFGVGAHVITTGNHVWDKKEAVAYLDRELRVLRPINYPPGVPGFGSYIYTTASGVQVGVINASGRTFMPPIDCPFRMVADEAERMSSRTKLIMVDFHAEATSEKIAFGAYMDGRVSAVIGTHTHVQTADERILPGGTAYITDAGMTGPVDSVIGVRTDQIVSRFLTMMPHRYETATGPSLLCGVVVEIDDSTGRALRIERVAVEHKP